VSAASPIGTIENSPAIHRWVKGFKSSKVPQGRKNLAIRLSISFVPVGTCSPFETKPTVETLGYGLSPCRAVDLFALFEFILTKSDDLIGQRTEA
jgi:hypothetical protein